MRSHLFALCYSLFSGGGDDDTDFVFEEFVRLRIAGAVDENAETDA